MLTKTCSSSPGKRKPSRHANASPQSFSRTRFYLQNFLSFFSYVTIKVLLSEHFSLLSGTSRHSNRSRYIAELSSYGLGANFPFNKAIISLLCTLISFPSLSLTHPAGSTFSAPPYPSFYLYFPNQLCPMPAFFFWARFSWTR